MAWGTPAGKRVVKIDTKRHLVLKAVHPSPLSAARGFFECGHFKQANGWLVTRYGEGSEIDWNLAPVAATNGEQAKDSETAKKVPVESIKPATVEEE
jgi:uracil-DNA glycosylase